MKYTIYKTTNKINNKIYIGFHITDDPNDDYLGSGKLLDRAIKKYGKSSFVKEVLHIFETPEEMFAKEAELVNEDFVARDDTYNIKLGGLGGWDWVNIRGLNISGRNQKEICKKIGHLGVLSIKNKLETDPFFVEKWKEKSRRGFNTRLKRGDPLSFLGKHHSDETKQRIGEANKKLIGDRNGSFGTVWITNGVENRKIKKETLDIWIEKGYIKGRQSKHCG